MVRWNAGTEHVTIQRQIGQQVLKGIMWRWSRSRRRGNVWPSTTEEENFLDEVSNSGSGFDYIVKAGQSARHD